ncbi:MAG: hypothetical protein ACLSVD_19655 [Eggerthellaceae bacterium]
MRGGEDVWRGRPTRCAGRQRVGRRGTCVARRGRKRQNARRLALLVSFLLFPVIIFYSRRR